MFVIKDKTMGKASELDDFLDKQPPLTSEEAHGPRPELQLRPELLAKALGPSNRIRRALYELNKEGADREVVLHDEKSGATAVAVPIELYLYLVTSHIQAMNLSEVSPEDGQIRPSHATLSVLGVEQVDPRAVWVHTGDPYH
jgi:hypothetical protein